MKVRITLTVEVDPQAWAAEYGIEPAQAAVRADVQSYVVNGIDAEVAAGFGLLEVVR